MIVALAACNTSPPASDEIVQLDLGTETCPHNYPCLPASPWSVIACDAVCGADGGYCEPYSDAAEAWCAIHPGQAWHGVFPCDAQGNPAWQTKCLPYFQP